MRKSIFYKILLSALLCFTATELNNAQDHQFNNIQVENGCLIPTNNHSDSVYKRNKFLSTLFINSNRDINSILKMDSIITSSLAGTHLKILFEYNSNEEIISQLLLSDVGNGWYNLYHDFFYYDESRNLLQEIHLGWNINSWDSLSRINYNYNPGEQLYQYVLQEYMNSSWVNVFRETFDYDSNGNQISTLNEKWDGAKWNNRNFVQNFYSNTNLRDSLIFKIWDNNEWRYFSKTHFYYNLQTNFLDYFIGKLWTGSNWDDYIKQSIINDLNGNQVEHLEELWEQGSWINSKKRHFSYNGLNYFESAFSETWTGNNWIPGEDIIIVENPDGYSIGFITHSVDIYYLVTGINEEIISNPDRFELAQNYPNPFNPSTTINYSVPQSGLVTLKVYNVIGQQVAELVNEVKQAGTHRIEFDASSLPSGVYMYKLSSGSFVSTKKMVMIK